MHLRLVLAACLIGVVPPSAYAQAIITQPLPPPPGSVLAPPVATPLVPRPLVPRPPAAGPSVAGPPVARPPVARPPAAKPEHAATAVPAPKKPAPKVAAKPAPKPVAKSAAKPAQKAAAKPAPKPPPAPTPPPAPAPAPPKIDPTKGSTTGLPLPRWVSFRSDQVNLRTGPGTQYPIDWVYHRRDLPVEVLREFEVWRLVEEQDGTKGWVHQATLTGRRGFVVQNTEQVLRTGASDTADPVARLEPGVVGHIRHCAAGFAWCEVQVGDYRGWLKRDGMYGVGPEEAIE